MSAQIASLKLGKYTYFVGQPGGLIASKILFRVARTLGPGAKGLAKGLNEEGLATALAAITESASEADFEFIRGAMADVTILKEQLANGQAIELPLANQFDEHFRGHSGNLLIWFQFAIVHNFASFLEEIKSGMPAGLGAEFLTLIKKSAPQQG